MGDDERKRGDRRLDNRDEHRSTRRNDARLQSDRDLRLCDRIWRAVAHEPLECRSDPASVLVAHRCEQDLCTATHRIRYPVGKIWCTTSLVYVGCEMRLVRRDRCLHGFEVHLERGEGRLTLCEFSLRCLNPCPGCRKRAASARVRHALVSSRNAKPIRIVPPCGITKHHMASLEGRGWSLA